MNLEDPPDFPEDSVEIIVQVQELSRLVDTMLASGVEIFGHRFAGAFTHRGSIWRRAGVRSALAKVRVELISPPS